VEEAIGGRRREVGTTISPPMLPFRRAFSSGASTIYALSTPPGVSAIAVVRLSGPSSSTVLKDLTRIQLPPPRVATLRHLYSPTAHKRQLDTALVVRFDAPYTTTGEDVVELHCHGGRAVVKAVIDALEGMRSTHNLTPAQPGEFTRRGFLNGRIKTLAEVEGLSDLLNAETEEQRVQAISLAGGELEARVQVWRGAILDAIAGVEAVLDFSADEEDVQEEVVWGKAVSGMCALASTLNSELAAGERGEIIRGGAKLVLTGAPNAGKSSLLNALIKRPAAIVSPHPGTTRDVLSVSLDLGGLKCTLSDTAGLREIESVDEVEGEGIKRALAEVGAAHVCLLVVDAPALAAAGMGYKQVPLDVLAMKMGRQGLQVVVALNKCDALKDTPHQLPPLMDSFSATLPGATVCCISAKTGEGLPQLLAALEANVKGVVWGESSGIDGTPLLTRPRYRHAVKECVAALQGFVDRSRVKGYGGAPELAGEDLRAAVKALSPLIGSVDREEILSLIFERFCIGK
jgi:tRNA modification GTPase